MPKRKTRGGATAAAQPASKKLRASAPVTSPAGRPLRSTAQEKPPTYNFNRPYSSGSSSAPKDSRSPTPAGVKRTTIDKQPARRGRPTKSVTPPSTTRGKQATKSNPPPVAGRGRGRPRKSVETQPESIVSSSAKVAGKGAKSKSTTDGASTNGHVEAGENIEDIIEEDGKQYWLMKAEPDSRIENGVDVKFSIDDLQARTEPEAWDGVRNYSARNNMRAMRKGDLAFFYHSNCKNPGIVGIMKIVDEHSVDESAFDPNHPYYDPKSSRDKPKWDVVKVSFVRKFDEQVSLPKLRSFAEPGGVLKGMQMLVQSRLSVSSVRPKEWKFIMNIVGEVEPESEAGDEVDKESVITIGEHDDRVQPDSDLVAGDASMATGHANLREESETVDADAEQHEQ